MRTSSIPSFRPLTVLGLATAGALLAGCSGAGDPASDAGTSAPDLGHVHALDVNPADGTLFVASHHGLFSLGSDGFERVSEAQSDLMSFAIAAPDRFLASGHPEPGADGPPHLGLAESADGGRTWRSTSLEGEADFHTLAPAGDRVYGVDSRTGRLMYTDDGTDWRSLGSLPAVDVAADPDDPSDLLLTDARGSLVHLGADGRPRPVETAPRLVLLDHAGDGLLVGAGPDGSVHRSVDGGETWGLVGSLPGAPHALTATESAWYAATDSGVVVSEDGGGTWAQVLSEGDGS